MSQKITIQKIKNRSRRIYRTALASLHLAWYDLTLKYRKRFQEYKTRLYGYTLYLNDPRSFFYEFRFIFKDEIYYFKSEKKDPFIIDGGGYLGMATLFFKKIYPEAKVTIFEPDTVPLSLLKKNIYGNGLRNVTIIESGLADHDGQLSFKTDTIDGGRIKNDGEQSIEVKRLSGFIDQTVDFLKLNIEGAELAVIRDLDMTGKIKKVKEMCIEWHSFKNEKQELDQLLSLLSRNGFRYFISNFSGSPHGRYRVQESNQYYLLLYAKNFNE